MRATVRRFHSPDANLDVYTSTDPSEDGLLVQMLVGPVDGPGEESFDVMVCTAAWLARIARAQGPVVGRHYLVMEHLDIRHAEAFLRSQVERLDEATWQELALKIGRLGMWELEDYRPKA
jgi:hypothetical protein